MLVPSPLFSSPVAAIADVGSALVANVDELAAELAGVVRRQVPGYGPKSLVSGEELRASCTENLRFVFIALRGDSELDLRAAEATGTQRAIAGVPLPAVMDAYRVGFRHLWQNTIAEAKARPDISSGLLLEITERVVVAHDSFTQAMAQAYNRQATAQVVADQARRMALVEALISGTAADGKTIWEIADLLRLPTVGPYVVVAAQVSELGRPSMADIEERLGRRDIRSAWRLMPDIQVGIVYVRQPAQQAILLETLNKAATAPTGVSPTYHDLAETVEGVRLARIASRGGNRGALVTVFDDRPLSIAAVSAPETMARLARGLLGALDALHPEDRETLIQTLSAWVDCGGSTAATAEKLYCHANTVRHRLHRIEKFTGKSLTRPRDVAELCLAIEVEARSARRPV